MPSTSAWFLVLAAALPNGFGGDSAPTGSALLEKVASLVDDRTYLAGHLAVAELDPGKFTAILEKAGVPAKETKPFRDHLEQMRTAFLDAGGRDVFVLMRLSGRLSPEHDFMVAVPLPEGKAAIMKDLLKKLRPPGSRMHKGLLVLAIQSTLDDLNGVEPKARPDLAEALDSMKDCAARVAVVPPAILRKVLVEMVPNLPKELGGASTRVLDRGVVWMALGLRTSDMTQRLVVRSADEKAAAALLDWLKDLYARAGNLSEVREMLPQIDTLRKTLLPRREKDRLLLTVEPNQLAAALVEPIKEMRKGVRLTSGVNNLKQLGLAMHNYHEVHKNFPPQGSQVPKGKGKLSWRVHLLPYLEQTPLYQQFKLDEPWDSPHNKKLIARMPAVFRSPQAGNLPEGKTTYLAPVGKGTIFSEPEGMPLNKILDGTSNTIMVVDADPARAVFWTQPEDLAVDAKNPVGGLFGQEAKVCAALFADGSVRILARTIDPATLWGLFTAAGGEVIGNVP